MHAEQVGDAEMVEQRRLGAHHVADVITGKRRPYGWPVAGSPSSGPVVPMQPPSTLAQMMK